jgi:hypothetical protein
VHVLSPVEDRPEKVQMLKGVDRAEDICDENYVIRGVLTRVHECTEALKIKSCLVSQDGEE